MQNNQYLNDKSEVTEDRFNRKPFAIRIAETIAGRTDAESLVIGMYGVWGEGKTTVLNYIRAELEENHPQKAIVVPFNPWRYGTEQELLHSFFETLADALDKPLYSKLQKAGKFLKEYGESFEFLGSPELLSLASEFLKATPVGPIASVGKGATKALVKHSEGNIENQKQKISEILLEAKQRIVIFIDDIDRLDKTEIQALFRLIKLTADFPYTCYVLSFDDEMVAAVLDEQYAGATNFTAGRNFLEKIIQVPLHIPKAPQSLLRDYFYELLNKILDDAGIILDQKAQDDFVSMLITGMEVRITTPRACKRYINALAFAIPILKGEVNTVDLMLSEGMRLFFPELYTFIRNNPEYINPKIHNSIAWKENLFKKRIKQFSDAALEKYNATEKEAALEVFTYLFPAYSTDYETGELQYDHRRNQSVEKWLQEKRIASEEYFERYFTYSVSDTDISESKIDDLLSIAESQTTEQVMATLQAQITNKNVESYMVKLRVREEQIKPETHIKLATAISNLGSLFPEPQNGNFFGNTPLSHATIFVYQGIIKLSSPQKNQLITDILNNAQPIYFGIRLFYRLRKARPNDESGFLTEADEQKYGELLVTRIESDFPRVFEMGDCHEIKSYVWIWGKYNPANIISYFDSLFADDRHFFKLLRCYFPQEHFARERYDELTSAISPEIIVKHLKRIYGELLEINVTYDRYNFEGLQGDEQALPKVAASQFLEIYNYIQENKKPEIS